jgi:hypothetical protein
VGTRAHALAESIREVETRGNCEARGTSGERGCFQFMPGTWKMWSKDVLGYVGVMTDNTEYYVVLRKIQGWIDAGYSDAQIARMWNQGHVGQCSAGVNKYGARYDSCAYMRLVLANL